MAEASEAVLQQLINRERSAQISIFLNKEKNWRDTPVNNDDIWSAVSKVSRTRVPNGNNIRNLPANQPTARPADQRAPRVEQNPVQNFHRGRGRSYNNNRGTARPNTTRSRSRSRDTGISQEERRFLERILQNM